MSITSLIAKQNSKRLDKIEHRVFRIELIVWYLAGATTLKLGEGLYYLISTIKW